MTDSLPTSPKHIVFVHGIFNTGRVFALMVRDARKYGFIPHAPSLTRADGRASLSELAQQIHTVVESSVPAGERCLLVGFSMGGIVARHYLQALGGRDRVERFVAIGSPHSGSIMAFGMPSRYFPGCADMRPRSTFLRQLHETEHLLDGLPRLALYTPSDTMIVPPRSAQWSGVETHNVGLHFHPFMPYSRRVRNAVWEFLTA
ncbi:MAG: alpha/beta fold hydrolase [Candidatus Kapabacteria bacterium]|nr:alpha/beta fold hydrolase [Candidatus Kapabacteria bacterium]